jgi:hypothetical protein
MLKRVLCAASFTTAAAITLYGAGCSSSSSPATGGKEGGVVMHPDSSTQKDTGPLPDITPPMETGPTSCTPATFTSTAVLHQAPASGTCSASDVNQIIDTCLLGIQADGDAEADPATACATLLKSSTSLMNCANGCMQTLVLDPSQDGTATVAWGGEIFLDKQGDGDVGYFNIGGCIAALDTSSTGQACATDFEGELECLTAACASCNLPTSTDTDAELTDYKSCTTAADPNTGTGVCSSFGSKIQTDCATEFAETGAAPGAACINAISFLDNSSASTPIVQVRAAFQVLIGSICAPSLVTADGGLGDGG